MASFDPDFVDTQEDLPESAAIVMLPDNFNPSGSHVLCQRGFECFNHAGNRKFRAHVETLAWRYKSAKTRLEKTSIVKMITDRVKSDVGSTSRHDTGFIKRDLLSNRWQVVDYDAVKVKVSQAFRDSLKTRRAGSKRQLKTANGDQHVGPKIEFDAAPVSVESAFFPAEEGRPDYPPTDMNLDRSKSYPTITSSSHKTVPATNFLSMTVDDEVTLARMDGWIPTPEESKLPVRRHSLTLGTFSQDWDPLPPELDIDDVAKEVFGP